MTRRKQNTIGDFVVVIINSSLHHSGPGLPVLRCSPLIRHGGGLELDYDLRRQTHGSSPRTEHARQEKQEVTFGLCMTMVSPEGNSSLRCHWFVDTALLYSA